MNIFGYGGLAGQLSARSSQFNLSQANSGASILTYQTFNVHNIFRPGSQLFQLFGYLSCFVTTLDYVLVLYGLVTNNHCNVVLWIQGLSDIFFYFKTYFSMHQTMMTFYVVVILIHTFTCMWLLFLTATKPISSIRELKSHILEDQANQRRWDYITSLYVIVADLTGTGGDEFLISDIYSMSILGCILVLGKMLAAVVVATAMQVAYSAQHALNKYETSTMELIDVLKNQGLSNYQLNKFWVYVQQLWVTERGRQLPALMAQTPYVRRCDLMTAMFGHHLRNCYLFSDTGEPFLRQLTVLLEYTIFFPGNYIVVAGDTESCMYWVESGSVSVVSVRTDLTETTHELLAPGDVFGIMQGLNRGVQHCFSYRAETKVSVLTLSLDSWVHILPFFPEAQSLINERAEVLFAQL